LIAYCLKRSVHCPRLWAPWPSRPQPENSFYSINAMPWQFYPFRVW